MLGKYVRVTVVNKIGSTGQNGFLFPLNFGYVEHEGKLPQRQMAYIMGIHHPVYHFDGRVIATLTSRSANECLWIVAPKSTRFIVNDIKQFLDMDGQFSDYKLDCLYESSCGAVIFKEMKGEARFLLIKNKRSAHWGFPKGHIEPGENKHATALREVLEETGLHIQILDDFSARSEYRIQGKIEKEVTIFIGRTKDTDIHIQQEELEDYIWLNYENALNLLKFSNDKVILRKAYDYLNTHNII